MKRAMGMLASGAVLFVLTACSAGDPGAASAPHAETEASTPAPTPTLAPLVEDASAKPECAADGDVVLSRGDGEAQVIVYGTGPTLVISPQLGYAICGMDAQGRELAWDGYRVVLTNADTPDAVANIVDAAAWARDHADGSDSAVGLLGASRGGTFVLAAGAAHPDAIVALSPPAQYAGVDATATRAENLAPTLIIVGDGDGQFPADGKKLKNAWGPDSTLTLIAGSDDHGVDFLDRDSPARPVIDRFFDSYLKKTSS